MIFEIYLRSWRPCDLGDPGDLGDHSRRSRRSLPLLPTLGNPDDLCEVFLGYTLLSRVRKYANEKRSKAHVWQIYKHTFGRKIVRPKDSSAEKYFGRTIFRPKTCCREKKTRPAKFRHANRGRCYCSV